MIRPPKVAMSLFWATQYCQGIYILCIFCTYFCFSFEQGKVEITRCVIYVPAGSVNLWTGINKFVAAKDIIHLKATTITTNDFESTLLVGSD